MTATPATTAGTPDWRTANRANWDERVPVHAAGPFYDLPGFVAGRDTLRDHEPAEVGDVSGRTLLHLQCHLGLDTLSWARRGAVVTGLDFSAPAVAAAADLAARIGADDARFVTSDVYGAAEALDGRTYDIVYTGYGALCWLPDLPRWARTVAALLTPGGFLYLAEHHPVADVLSEDGRSFEEDYFERTPIVVDHPGTYADPDARLDATVTVQWQHGLGEVVTALTGAGLRLDFLHEHAHGHFRVPAGSPAPQSYSLRATLPR
ncbi:class I SAM-dependent methyltransferase [Kitasatospora sp. NPDC005856]|uniref:class I SAM-dependent methyltransferase n=1 Tax=Kitasatospora sp. NPDC005856 TaxID=3154566 RepID=UPI0033F2B819